MIMAEIIAKKRDGRRLSADEISDVIQAYTAGSIPDYQMAALLMAAFIRGLDADETAALTAAMAGSGSSRNLSAVPGAKIDKHSTGGVGDGTSLVLAPLAACAGIIVPMMSGRTLGHTGGTLDKLESIPGFRVQLSADEYGAQLLRLGVAMIGQSADVAPADRKLYALRDVTATVESIPLIAASIMSKKLVEGSEGLVLDVKTGSGAFMRSEQDAVALARLMVSIGRRNGMAMAALVTDMSRPLGGAVGNALEVAQAIDVLRGSGPADFVELVLALGSRMVVLGGRAATVAEAEAVLKKHLASGAAAEKFRALVAAQGGDPRVVDDPGSVLPQARQCVPVRAAAAGFVAAMDTREIGVAAQLLGAGRLTKEDVVDPAAGIRIFKKTGDPIVAGSVLAELQFNATARADEAAARIAAAYTIAETPPVVPPLIRQEITQA